MAEDKRSPPDWKQQLDTILDARGQNNNICADCLANSSDSNWSVWNHGIFVCIKCAGVHRQIGVHISRVKSTQFDKWHTNELKSVKAIGGNLIANKKLEHRKPKYFLTPSQCDNVDDVRKFYIQQKYEYKLFQNDRKDDVGIHDMPQTVVIGAFFHEDNKKKAFLQLLGRTLYYFKNNHDSYDTEQFDVTSIDATICNSDSDNTDCVLNIYKNNDESDSIYRLRPIHQNDTMLLIEWTHSLRRAKQYYSYLNESNNDRNINDSEQKENKQSEPFTEIRITDVKQGLVLGIASKKGGGARSWRKRWWLLLNGTLYYFKDDFRINKKTNGIGVPQGNISLYNADIIWDKDRIRTGKQNGFMICTPNRTFYVQPQQQIKDTFFNAIYLCCNRLWDRKPFDFVTMG